LGFLQFSKGERKIKKAHMNDAKKEKKTKRKNEEKRD
jgi:hypothetical protein